MTVAEQRQFGEVGGSVLPALIESGGGVVVATALLLLFALTQANMVVGTVISRVCAFCELAVDYLCVHIFFVCSYFYLSFIFVVIDYPFQRTGSCPTGVASRLTSSTNPSTLGSMCEQYPPPPTHPSHCSSSSSILICVILRSYSLFVALIDGEHILNGFCALAGLHRRCWWAAA